MGLGLQGRGVGDALIFIRAGAKVTVTDLKPANQLQPSLDKLKDLPVRLVLGQHQEQDVLQSDLILRNPDVDYHHPLLELARSKHIPVKMDSSLFATYCHLPIIGITGTRGKTTTATMIYEMLRQVSRQPAFLGGNIPGQATLELLPVINDIDKGWIVLELSSWELQGWHDENISPHIAIFTNFYEDHLNRYSSMDEYFQDKLAITQYQKPSDWLLVNRNDHWSRQVMAHTPAQIRWFSSTDLPADINLAIPGVHNRTNAAAALAAANILGLDQAQVSRVLANFPGVPYRLQTVTTINGVTFINDTTSTTPTATLAALQAISESVLLIAGGSDKNLDFSEVGQAISAKVKRVFLLEGSATPKLIQAISQAKGDKLIHGQYTDIKTAVTAAVAQAQPGDVVLFSPACASFGMFINEFDRGDQFNRIIKSLSP